MRLLPAALAFAAALVAVAPAAADEKWRGRPDSEFNPHWRDYKTDVSEAKRELRNDLRGAKSRSDRRNAMAEYRREVADARDDYEKEMVEQGYTVRQLRRAEVRLEAVD